MLSFLPPNITSLIQPCNQGIIRNLKANYSKQVVKQIVENIDASKLSTNEIAKQLTLLDIMQRKEHCNAGDETSANIQNLLQPSLLMSTFVTMKT
jgi:uncharacterized protein with gpF-like domain